MKRTRIAFCSSLIVLAASIANGADVSGVWKTEFESQIGVQKYTFVFANIVADVIIALASILPLFIEKAGVLIASGIIDTRKDEVITTLQQYGFTIKEVNENKGWIGLVCVFDTNL